MKNQYNTSKNKTNHICKNCMLYNFEKHHCSVIILHEGEKINLPTDPSDECFFEGQFIDKNGKNFTPEVEEVKIWCENPKTGAKSDNGVVKIEYPIGFFGDEEKCKDI